MRSLIWILPLIPIVALASPRARRVEGGDVIHLRYGEASQASEALEKAETLAMEALAFECGGVPRAARIWEGEVHRAESGSFIATAEASVELRECELTRDSSVPVHREWMDRIREFRAVPRETPVPVRTPAVSEGEARILRGIQDIKREMRERAESGASPQGVEVWMMPIPIAASRPQESMMTRPIPRITVDSIRCWDELSRAGNTALGAKRCMDLEQNPPR